MPRLTSRIAKAVRLQQISNCPLQADQLKNQQKNKEPVAICRINKCRDSDKVGRVTIISAESVKFILPLRACALTLLPIGFALRSVQAHISMRNCFEICVFTLLKANPMGERVRACGLKGKKPPPMQRDRTSFAFPKTKVVYNCKKIQSSNQAMQLANSYYNILFRILIYFWWNFQQHSLQPIQVASLCKDDITQYGLRWYHKTRGLNRIDRGFNRIRSSSSDCVPLLFLCFFQGVVSGFFVVVEG